MYAHSKHLLRTLFCFGFCLRQCACAAAAISYAAAFFSGHKRIAHCSFIPIRARLRHTRLYPTNETPSRRVDSIGELLIAHCALPIAHSFPSGRACGTPGYILRMRRLPGVSILLENCSLHIAHCALLIAHCSLLISLMHCKFAVIIGQHSPSTKGDDHAVFACN